MNDALKQALDELLDICDKNSKQTHESESISFERSQLKKDIVNFLSYLSSSDGIISSY